MHIHFDLIIPFLDVYHRVIHTHVQNVVCITIFIATWLIITKGGKQTNYAPIEYLIY